MQTTERRFAKTQISTDAEGVLRGKIFYNTPSQPISQFGKVFTEFLAPGVFKRSLAARKSVTLTAGHQSADPLNCLARWPDGGLTINDTATGLEWSAQLPDTAAARDLHALVKAGVIKGASFEFMAAKGGDKWEQRGGKDVRTITDADLTEINPVTSPAYPDNTLEARRAANQETNSPEDVRETRLRIITNSFPHRRAAAARFGIPV